MDNKEKILDFLGLNINIKDRIKDIIKSIIFSYIFIFTIILIKIIISNYTIEDLKIIIANRMSISGTIIYCIFCFAQELFARGILQRSIKRKTNNTAISIIITTIIFCLLHYKYDIVTIIGAFVISILTGIITNKDDNIIRGFFMHWIIGGFGYVFLSNMVM